MSFHSYDSSVRLAPQTASRIAKEVRDLVVTPETGVCLVVDEATGLPPSLQELTVRVFRNAIVVGSLPCLVGCVVGIYLAVPMYKT